MNLPVSYILLDITDKPEVSFYVAIAISVLTTSARLWICHSLLKFPIINFIKSVFGKIIPTTILSISPMLLYRYVNDLNLFASLCVCLSIVLLSIWFVGLENGEKEMVKNKLLNALRKMVKYALSALFHYFKQFAIARKLNKTDLKYIYPSLISITKI